MTNRTFLVCPGCWLACFEVHSDPAKNAGVFTNRREALPPADACLDKHTAPCGLGLIRLDAREMPTQKVCSMKKMES